MLQLKLPLIFTDLRTARPRRLPGPVRAVLDWSRQWVLRLNYRMVNVDGWRRLHARIAAIGAGFDAFSASSCVYSKRCFR